MLPNLGLQQQAAAAAEASCVSRQALEHLCSCRPIRCVCRNAVLEQAGDRRRTPAAGRQFAELPTHRRRLHDQLPQDHTKRENVHLLAVAWQLLAAGYIMTCVKGCRVQVVSMVLTSDQCPLPPEACIPAVCSCGRAASRAPHSCNRHERD
jgi:hypothetical protein